MRGIPLLLFATTMSFATLHPAPAAQPSELDVVPQPAEAQVHAGARFRLLPALTTGIESDSSDALRSAVSRALRLWEVRTGLAFPRAPDGKYAFSNNPAEAQLIIKTTHAQPKVPALGDDESYTLLIATNQIRIEAGTVAGVRHALSTLVQLLSSSPDGWELPLVRIQDRPRFRWRGLLLDSARHFMPVEVIKRQLDAMALVKLNVLHFHLSDDQGFRVESKVWPKLHEVASEGQYYTQQQIRELVEYAAERGIRVVPEFDVPGHTTAMLVAYPNLAAQPGPYHLIPGWGIFSPVLDPTKEEVYDFLEKLFAEMAGLFPDEYFHIGGDEVDGKHWNASSAIQHFIREHKLGDNHGLQAHFNFRLQSIIARTGKKLIGWDEILHPHLPRNAVIQAWQGPHRLAAAVRAGYATVLSAGYYLDLMHSAATHYSVDPSSLGSTLTDAEREHVLGGEACMWAEWITPDTIESRLWPRAAAVAERLWSPADCKDVESLYRRLSLLSGRLEDLGSRHESNRRPLMRAFAGDSATPDDVAALEQIADLVEPVKGYQRGAQQPTFTRWTPLNGLVDFARPESLASRRFAQTVHGIIASGSASPEKLSELARMLTTWQNASTTLLQRLDALSPRMKEIEGVLMKIRETCTIGLEALALLKRARTSENGLALLSKTQELAQAEGAVEIPIIPAVELLVAATIPPHQPGESIQQRLQRIKQAPQDVPQR